MNNLASASPERQPQHTGTRLTEPQLARRLRQASAPGIPRRLLALCNTIAFHADPAGLFAWSVRAMVHHRHFKGRKKLSERTVQYQLRELELVGALEVVSPATGNVDKPRVYRVQFERFSELSARRYCPSYDPAWVKGSPPIRGAKQGCKNGSKRGAKTAAIINYGVLTRSNPRGRASQEPELIRKRDFRLWEIDQATHLSEDQRARLRSMTLSV